MSYLENYIYTLQGIRTFYLYRWLLVVFLAAEILSFVKLQIISGVFVSLMETAPTWESEWNVDWGSIFAVPGRRMSRFTKLKTSPEPFKTIAIKKNSDKNVITTSSWESEKITFYIFFVDLNDVGVDKQLSRTQRLQNFIFTIWTLDAFNYLCDSSDI